MGPYQPALRTRQPLKALSEEGECGHSPLIDGHKADTFSHGEHENRYDPPSQREESDRFARCIVRLVLFATIRAHPKETCCTVIAIFQPAFEAVALLRQIKVGVIHGIVCLVARRLRRVEGIGFVWREEILVVHGTPRAQEHVPRYLANKE